MKLTGKTAVITGAASGIGAAIAEVFVAAGAKVIVADIDRQNGAAKAQAVGGMAVFEYLDVTNWPWCLRRRIHLREAAGFLHS